MRNNYGVNHIMNRDGVYYYIRRVPCDLSDFYAIKRLCFSLKTKSLNTARRLSRSIEQKLEDYWLGLRLQNLDIPQIKVSSKPSDTLDQDGVSLSFRCYLRPAFLIPSNRVSLICWLSSGITFS